MDLIPLTKCPFSIITLSNNKYFIKNGKKSILFDADSLKFHQINIKNARSIQPFYSISENKSAHLPNQSDKNQKSTIIVSHENSSINFQKIKLEELNQAINETEMTWGIGKEYKLIRLKVFGDFLIGVFGNEEFYKKRKLGKTAHPFHFDMKGSELFFYNR